MWKRAFITAPVLKIPNDEDLFKLSTDVSNFATSAVLSQKILTTGLWHSLTFFSKLLYIYERNYKIYNKELLAIIRRLEEYHYHLEGHLHKIEIWLDHQNLTFFRTAQKLTRRQARWALYITCFDYILYHELGKTM